MKHFLALLTAALLTCLGSGCASTQAVRDSAANAAQMMREVAPEVEQYRTAVQVGEADIAATVAAARVRDESTRIWLNQRVRFDVAGRNSKRIDLYTQTKTLSDSLLADDEAFFASKAKIEAEMASLLRPLPATAPKLNQAVSAVLVLGQERSARVQFEEALVAWEAVVKATKENRDKLKTPTPQAQP